MRESDLQQCIDLAMALVSRRRGKARKRKETQRSLNQYRRSRFAKDFVSTLREALDRGKSIAGIQDRLSTASQVEQGAVISLVHNLLRRDLLSEYKSRGRPRKATGLIASVMRSGPVTRQGGRPRTVDAATEKLWSANLWGAALGLWADQECLPRGSSIDDVIAVLVQDEEWRFELEKLRPRAIRLPAMKDINPPAKNYKALLKRASRAQKAHPMPRKLKNGG